MAANFCPADCAEHELVDNPTGGCDTKFRKRSIDKIGFYLCTTDLPSPLTCVNLQTLMTAKDIVWTSPLVNAEWADPTYESIKIAECIPGVRTATGRVLTFQDRIAIEIADDPETDPEDESNKYWDYGFWLDKQQVSIRLRYLVKYCDGEIEVLKEANGTPMAGTFDIYRSQERQGSGNNSFVLEIKKGQIEFMGDPLQFVAPELDTSDCTYSI